MGIFCMHGDSYMRERRKERDTHTERDRQKDTETEIDRATEAKVRLFHGFGKDAEIANGHPDRNFHFSLLQLENCFGSQVPEQG